MSKFDFVFGRFLTVDTRMLFSQPDADLFFPKPCGDGLDLSACTHLGIGAHADDLEFMALHGILECYGSATKQFCGITCTDGLGSARGSDYQQLSDREFIELRADEQRSAAEIGQYHFMAQLSHPSRHAQNAAHRSGLVEDIFQILQRAEPEEIYTHNPFDKHPTHVGVLEACLEAIHQLPADSRPRKVWGCEVWRGLDWLPDSLKVLQDVSEHADLAESLNACFQSQISGGKRYDLAVEGRRRANATFSNPRALDAESRLQIAIDLSPLIHEDMPLPAFKASVMKRFESEIMA